MEKKAKKVDKQVDGIVVPHRLSDKYRKEYIKIMRQAAEQMQDLKRESEADKAKMQEYRHRFYKSLETVKREAPNGQRPFTVKMKHEFRDESEGEDEERDLGEHVLSCELETRKVVHHDHDD